MSEREPVHPVQLRPVQDEVSAPPAPSDSSALPTFGPRPVPARFTRRRAGSRTRWAIAIAAVLALGVGLVRAFAPVPVVVEVGTVSRGPLRVAVLEDGRTRVTDRFVVAAPLTGTLGRIELQPGDTVRRGDPVAQIIPPASPLLDPRARAEAEARVAAAVAMRRQAQAARDRARAAADQASRDAARERTLLRAGATAARTAEEAELAERMRREELASVEFGVKVAEAELAIARAAVRRLQPGTAAGQQLAVPAPVDGQVLRVLQESEGVVQAGAPLVEIGDPTTLEAVIDVLTTDAVRIAPGDPVRIEQWGGDSALSGHVHRVEPSAFTRVSALGVEEQRVNVIVHLDEVAGQSYTLGDGFRVEASIAVWEEPDVLQVPSGAVFRRGEGWGVYVVEAGRARLRPVEIGHRTDTSAQVRHGIEAGAAVVLYPGDTIRDGQRVEPAAVDGRR
ncbi:MAG TPA: efflux RND transporter periplasmic adaptor subunit [Gemmatimonadales bacterium]|nr:efflux RND transporter periplasmic adaptor subunit [Gemmatimonadales bacterium]